MAHRPSLSSKFDYRSVPLNNLKAHSGIQTAISFAPLFDHKKYGIARQVEPL